MEALLEAVFYRQSCPTAEQLLDYHLGLLASTVDRQLRQHIELCPHCTADLRDLLQVGLAVQPASTNATQRVGLLRRLQQLIPNLTLLPALSQTSLALPTLRSGEESDLRVFNAGDYRLSLSLLRVTSSPMVSIEGSLLNIYDPSQSFFAGKVHLLLNNSEEKRDEAVRTEMLDEFGMFTFAALKPGSYALAIELVTQTILISDVVISV